MTASMGDEVQSNRLFGAAPEGTLAGAKAVDGEREDGGDLGEVAGWRFAVGREKVRACHAIQRSARNCYFNEKPVAVPKWNIARMQGTDHGRDSLAIDRALPPAGVFATRDCSVMLRSYRAEFRFMPKAPHKSCPSLYHLIEHTEANDIASFLGQDEFSRQKWLEAYCQIERDNADRTVFEKLLHDESKSRFEPL